MSPLHIRSYVKVHKNDDCDAQAIAEAATRPTMSFVVLKSEEQLDLQARYRARARLVSDRTRLIDQGRGFLMERGIRVGSGRHVFQKELTRLTVEGVEDLSRRMPLLLSDMASELPVMNDRIAAIDAQIKALAKTEAYAEADGDPGCRSNTRDSARSSCRHRQFLWQRS
jgi:transposase